MTPRRHHTPSRWPARWSLAVAVLLTAAPAFAADLLRPGPPTDYGKLAFNPGEWTKRGLSTVLVPWTGERVVFLTTNANLDPRIMTLFLARLDGGWKLYADLTGRTPGLFKQLDGKPTIAAVPRASLTCGYGCGYIGATGIEVAGFYADDYPLVTRQTNAFPHYYFYEMGRNFYTFGDRHSAFITGSAVFMRYVCMDALGCDDPDRRTRDIIERAEDLYAKSGLSFLKAFTMLGGLSEKEPRLKHPDGKPLQPSDQPVIYASAMLKLRRDCGGDAWVKRFFAQLVKCPKIKADSAQAALRQSLSWLVAASCAARKDLSGLFVDRWRLPLSPETRQALARVRWEAPSTDASTVLGLLPADPFAPVARVSPAGGPGN